MGAVSLFGTPEQREWLDKTRRGKAIAAFALTEPGSGSDVANTATTATRDGTDFILNGEKTYISNGGIADLYVVFARTGEAPGAKGCRPSCFRRTRPGWTWSRGSRSSRPIRWRTFGSTTSACPKPR